MNKSIRGTLLFWYALILTGVLGGFGGLVYHGLRRARIDEMVTVCGLSRMAQTKRSSETPNADFGL